MIVKVTKKELIFKQPVQTSREVLKTREVWFLHLINNKNHGIGECAPIFGLSQESKDDVESVLIKICNNPQLFIENLDLLNKIPSVKFGLETALLNLKNKKKHLLYPSDFTRGKIGIPINGLVWMGSILQMQKDIDTKIKVGFKCIKLKIGVLDFDKELELIKSIRRKFKKDKLTIRVDANGAFKKDEALDKLIELAKLDIHSIEQPIKAGNWEALASLCINSPLPIALDEELIGLTDDSKKRFLLEMVNPAYLILKPSLHGGIEGCDHWIALADEYDISWWATSYLESNIGLNAIAQWVYSKGVTLEQGLGTGQLFSNNIESPLSIDKQNLVYNPDIKFKI